MHCSAAFPTADDWCGRRDSNPDGVSPEGF
jgi:hypothetical protein